MALRTKAAKAATETNHNDVTVDVDNLNLLKSSSGVSDIQDGLQNSKMAGMKCRNLLVG